LELLWQHTLAKRSAGIKPAKALVSLGQSLARS